MRPLCSYGFPCRHKFYDGELDFFCAYPLGHEDSPKMKDFVNLPSRPLICDMTFYCCPIIDHLSIFNHIEKMLDDLCLSCGGEIDAERPCPDCNSTGLKTEHQRQWEKDIEERILQRCADKKLLQDNKEKWPE